MSEKPLSPAALEFAALWEAAPRAKKLVSFMLIALMTAYPKSNRGQGGRFRKPLSDEAYMIELLEKLKEAPDCAEEAEQAEIQHWIDQLEKIDREKQGQQS